jgi:hypothetical protein
MPARQLIEAIHARRQLGLLDDHDREAILDGKLQAALLADEAVAVEVETGLALRVHRTAQDFEQIRANHGVVGKGAFFRTAACC